MNALISMGLRQFARLIAIVQNAYEMFVRAREWLLKAILVRCRLLRARAFVRQLPVYASRSPEK
jgi:hypothetical protein